ncbi:hypothetical protein KXD93_24570 [Mucilaginibacter sp. BJC16-A38]|uniref:hypothetical protein n=1 Tax=Mucilaginibacter phenanthrenivorans TaxID=1234842 RepID=UPI0021581BC5|nr:hypothetical protein [Mucilaginibacter phenanthrenivorans]MCR8560855.1 hypothetical protein [Mucilaginibacter phenanthrenivorans]
MKHTKVQKPLFLFLFLLLNVFVCYSQSTATNSNTTKELTGTFQLNDSVANKNLVFNYHIIIDGTGKVKTEITNVESTANFDQTFTLFSQNAEAYYAAFNNSFATLTSLKKVNIREASISVFAKVEARIEIKDDQPNTAHIKLLKANLPVTIEYKLDATNKDVNSTKSIIVSVEQVDIEFEDGTIKNLFLTVKVPDQKTKDKLEDGRIQFRNNFPIGISGKFSPERLRDNEMYAFDACRVEELLKADIANYSALTKDQNNPQPCIISNAKFNLAELIDFRPILESEKEDYSPANQVISLTPTSDDIIVKKEKRSKILEVRSYTDLIGTDGKSPNGLIQIEGRKKIFLLEDKTKFFSEYAYFGGLTYVEPVVRFSKIDNNNKNLIPDTIGSAANLISKKKKVLNLNTIDLYKYQLNSFTLNVNMLNFSFPQIKLNVLIDGKAGVYRTSITDSLSISANKLIKTPVASTNTVNVALYGVNLMFTFLPDSRYQFSFGYSWLGNKMLSDNYLQNKGQGISSYWIDGYFKTSESSKLFIRGSFNQQNSDTRLNFVQAQIGVTLDIFRANSKLDQ